jgi:hypothetical protein
VPQFLVRQTLHKTPCLATANVLLMDHLPWVVAEQVSSATQHAVVNPHVTSLLSVQSVKDGICLQTLVNVSVAQFQKDAKLERTGALVSANVFKLKDLKT